MSIFNTLNIISTIESTSTSTGSLIVDGGLSNKKNLFGTNIK